MNPAIFYHPDAYSTTMEKVMGRNVAGETFLRAFLRHARNEVFWSQAFEDVHDRAFERLVRGAGRTEPVRSASGPAIAGLREAGVIHYPDPVLTRPAWQRSHFGDDAWSMTGITHTTTSHDAMDAIVGLMTAPVQPWDALICTSNAARANVQALLQGQGEYLADRFGITRAPLPQLPVIPLGVDCADFAFLAADRAAARTALGLGEDALVVMFMGRLAFHAKAHPLPMYIALEQAAASAPGPVVLIECGRFGSQSVADAYAAGAAAACPSVRRIHLDSTVAENRRMAWAGADVFASLSDNLQETFGLTPVEAMAAGLPVVVSDWDGYRDTVRDGIDGFRVPTAMPEIDHPGDLAVRHALLIDPYDIYISRAAMQVAVDIGETAGAFARLFASPDLRARMGAAGRARARSDFDWATIVPRYEALWTELEAIRRRDGSQAKRRRVPWPARPDPFHVYAAWPTASITADTVFALVASDPEAGLQRWQELNRLAMVNSVSRSLVREADLALMLAALGPGPAPLHAIAQALPEQRRSYAMRMLAVLAKFGIVRIVRPDGSATA